MDGQTTLEEAKRLFASLRLLLSRTNTRDNKEFYAVVYRLDNGIEITPILTVQENVVSNLYVGIIPEPQQPGVPRGWLAYSPETLVARYGTPSRVDFFLGRREPPRYSMQIYFETVDLIVQYGSFDVTFVPEGIRVCPMTDQYDSIGVWLGENPEHPPGTVVPLEVATSITTEEFAELLIGNPKDACINLNEDAFP